MSSRRVSKAVKMRKLTSENSILKYKPKRGTEVSLPRLGAILDAVMRAKING